ncbi:hypothetical protein IscW_ISCW007891 [Ixodes scapularis]|uniref:HYR domain-containing protein n=1 Tax=Ixodes scapularis TaxID=6945 RepID=B7PWM2_IXOSC|nr:hypothetical protein IscW_ISCW007891 [Ixodes scapularis]|eukprot:XP_002410037.1 hypothetical protein IscW_ISCW007891 [Ixodes scapularis]
MFGGAARLTLHVVDSSWAPLSKRTQGRASTSARGHSQVRETSGKGNADPQSGRRTSGPASGDIRDQARIRKPGSAGRLDNEEPVIRCPANITQSVRAGRRGAIVMWKQPEARDNSGVLPEIQQDPENIVSPWRFPIGQTAIRFRATDAARLSTECTFTVTVFLKPSKRMLKDTVFFGKEYISTLYVVHVRFLHTGSYQFRTSK